MKIESIIKRDPPTEVLLGDTAYKFTSDSKGRHVCEVTDKAHIARLLSIAEGFQIPDDEDAPKAVIPPVIETPAPVVLPTIQPTEDPDILLGADGYPAVIDLGNGETVEIVDVIAQAHELSFLTTADWNALETDVRSGLIDAVLDAMAFKDDSHIRNEDGTTTLVSDLPPDEQKEIWGAPKIETTEGADAKPPVIEKTPVDDKAKYDAEREALALEYKAKFGNKPHCKWTMDKIREELAKPTDAAKD